MMRRILKVIGWFLVLISLAVVAVTVQLYSDRKAALEYAVAMTSDYRLSINGDFSFLIESGITRITLKDAVLKSKFGDASLLHVGRLDVIATINGFSLKSASIDNLVIADAQAILIRHEDGSLNWPLLINAIPDNASSMSGVDHTGADWDVLLGLIQLENLALTLQGFGDQEHTLVLERLKLEQGSPRMLIAGGRLNHLPFSMSSELSGLSDFILDKAPVRLNTTATFDTLDLILKGSFGNINSSTRLQFSANTKNLSQLSELINEPIIKRGSLSFSGLLLNQGGNYQISDANFLLDSPALVLSASGSAEQLEKGYDLALKMALSSNDIGQLASIDNLERLDDWQGWQVSLNTDISYQQSQNNRQGLLTGMVFNATDRSQSLVISSQSLQLQSNKEYFLKANAKLADLIYQYADENTLITQPWVYQYKAQNINAHIKDDFSVHIKTQGTFKDIFVSTDGLWQKNGAYSFNAHLERSHIHASGYLRGDDFSFIGKLKTPSLKLLADLLDEEEIPIDHGELMIAIEAKGDDVVLKNFDLVLENAGSKLTLTGGAKGRLNFDDYNLVAGIKSASLLDTERWVRTSGLSVERSIGALGDIRSFSSQGDVKYKQSLVAVTPWLQNFMSLLALNEWITEYPSLNGSADINVALTGAGDSLLINMDKVAVQSSLADIHWSGRMQISPKLDLQGSLQAQLQVGAIDGMMTAVTIDSSVLQKSDGPLTLSKLHVAAGNTRLSGELDLLINDGLQKVIGAINFQRLDLLPYFPEPIGKNKNDQKVLTNDQLVFSDEEFSLAWLPQYTVDVAMTAAVLNSPWFEANALKLSLKNTDKVFNLDGLELMIGEALLTGEMQLYNHTPTPKLSLSLRAEKLDIDSISLLRNYDVVHSGSVNLLLDLASQGKSQHQIMSGVNGRLTTFSRDLVLNGRDLENVAPEILTEVNRKINPFYKDRRSLDTVIECGLIHFDINNGLMEADKSILLISPNIAFAANGAIDLSAEALRFQIVPRSRKGLGISLLGSFAKMAVIDGPFNSPKVFFDPKSAIKFGARDVTGTVLMGPIYWLYLGQADKLLASPRLCEESINKLASDF
jgi:hypothetical protein